MLHVLKVSLMSIAVGFLAQMMQRWLRTTYLNDFLSDNLLMLLIALLAINSATMGIVLTKIRELVERRGKAEVFTPTRNQMVLAVREQIGLIVLAAVLLTGSSSSLLGTNADILLLIDTLIFAVFTYAIFVLYDTAIGVLIIVDFDPDGPEA